MSPGAGAELKHLIDNVKTKASKHEGSDNKDEGLNLKDKNLNLKDKGREINDKSLNLKALGEAVKGANSNRQTVAVWSPKISAVMWYLKKTTPEFSISDEARAILEEGLEKKYPELFQKVKKEMGQG
jgi:hypothetical protein